MISSLKKETMYYVVSYVCCPSMTENKSRPNFDWHNFSDKRL